MRPFRSPPAFTPLEWAYLDALERHKTGQIPHPDAMLTEAPGGPDMALMRLVNLSAINIAFASTGRPRTPVGESVTMECRRWIEQRRANGGT